MRSSCIRLARNLLSTDQRPGLPLIVKNDIGLSTPNYVKRIAPRANVITTGDDEEDTTLQLIPDASILLTCYAKVTDRILAAAPKLRAVVKYGVGIDQIDTAAAKRRGIVVVNVPLYAESTVAEHAFALMISLMKKVHVQQCALQKEWLHPNTPQWLGSDLEGKTVGIVGLGHIGSAFARMCSGFRMRVIAYDPYKTEAYCRDRDVEKMPSLDELASCADILATHAVLNAETHHLVSARILRLLKPHAIVINTARGALIDEKALIDSLLRGAIAGAGIDVFSTEPVPLSGHAFSPLYPLIQEGRVLLTPHLAFYTTEAMNRLETEMLERTYEVLDGRPVTIKSKDPRLQGQEGVLYRPE